MKSKNNENNTRNNEEMMMILYKKMRRVIETSAVVVFSLGSECCMCHVAKHLLFGLGVAPTVVELDSSGDIATALHHLTGGDEKAVPAIFVGGKLLGGIESLMASHINGSLVPLLKEAGALWL
ncbi:hypothetical protein RND81_11G167500 [Saponaria officinalis]|uniref:Glutaredoxin domain-containing protein n=1 Tax=Saponaria officinalis TaxID=3572 RepID=A0AAW1HM44_SAPOF